MASGGITKTAVWILMAMLVFGLGGFGITNLSGGVRPIGTVGDEEISMNEYARSLQQELRAIEAQSGAAVSLVDAQAAGLDRAVLARLVVSAALDNEAHQMGLSIGDENLSEQIRSIDAFRGPDGKFNRQAYDYALDNAGLNESEFETQLRNEAARTLLQGAVLGGTKMPESYTDAVISFVAERRNISYIRLDAANLTTPLTAPSEEELDAYYQAHLDAFEVPEKKAITYAWLTPEMLIDQVDVAEADVQTAYDKRADEFNTPERRLVERLAFADLDTAKDAIAKIIAGETDFETLVADRGLSLQDVDLGDVGYDALGAASDGVFNAEIGQTVGPFESAIGPALFRVNGVLAATSVPLDDVREELRDELALDQARRLISGKITAIDSLLAGGATLEELEGETDMRIATINWWDESTDTIANYEAFRQAAATVTSDDYPVVTELEDGGIFALRLDDVIPARVQPLTDVLDAAEEAWRLAETDKLLLAQAQELVTKLEDGADMAEQGYEVTDRNDVTRGQFILGTPSDFLETAFDMSAGEYRALAGEGAAFVLRVNDMLPPDAENENVAALRDRIATEAQQGVTQDLFQAYTADLQRRAGVSIDQAAVAAVHANFR